MKNNNWTKITRDNVIDAITKFEKENPNFPQPRSTFLIYNGKTYPAKHIRGMAYKEAFKKEISKEEYTGGMETVRFFKRLGFDSFYRGQLISGKTYKRKKDISIRQKEVTEQKNALQKLLNKYFDGDIVCEKTFDWLKTPSEIKDEYTSIYLALNSLNGDEKFAKKNYCLRCDFVCENQKVIIEYDERQHFSKARMASLLAYPENLNLNYNKELWLKACEQIAAKDNDPRNRDEIRAYYDSVRDIESAKNGYTLIRIMHDQFDWNRDDAYIYLKRLLDEKRFGNPKRENLKIGLYLQTDAGRNEKDFKKALRKVKNSNLDILVFPEVCYCPEIEVLNQYNLFNIEDVRKVKDYTLSLSEALNKAVVLSISDISGFTYSIYANSNATEEETKFKIYLKHIMTDLSPLDLDNFKEIYNYFFEPIVLKGNKIGLTICYDCNNALFSRLYGLRDVDILINSTGGDVKYHKWHKYNKVRAIENNCFSLVTMGGNGDKSYVYGFSPNGKELPYSNLMEKVKSPDLANSVYVFEANFKDKNYQNDLSFNQTETINKYRDFYFPVDNLNELLESSRKINDHLYVRAFNDQSLVFGIVDGLEILNPEEALRLIYYNELNEFQNKRYFLINKFKQPIKEEFYNTVLSIVLKVRAMENYCAVILDSPNFKKCFQTTKTREVQSVKLEDGSYGIDLMRTKGPEVIWRNETGKRAGRKNNYRWLVNKINNEREN